MDEYLDEVLQEAAELWADLRIPYKRFNVMVGEVVSEWKKTRDLSCLRDELINKFKEN